MDIKISVIVPVYNVEKYLSQCLDSIIRQSMGNIEIICINDGATDNSKAILEEYAAKDDRILLVNKPNGGYGSACNIGLKLAKGKYISIIEPDDFISTEMYEKMLACAEKYDADIVKTPFYEYFDGDDTKEQSAVKINWSEQCNIPKQSFRLKDCPEFCYFHPSIWSCLFKKSFLDDINASFVEAKGGGWVDNPFQVKAFCLAKKIVFVDEAFYHYRVSNPTSSSNILTLSNPFDRSNEIHEFLDTSKINDKNILANLYKRELDYIRIVLTGISQDLFDEAAFRVKAMVARMDKQIIKTHKCLNDFEKKVWEKSQTSAGINELIQEFSCNANKVEIVV